MPAVYHCLIHGLVLASVVELPLPRVEPRCADVTYRVALDTKLPPSSHSRSDDPDSPWAVEHWMGHRLAVEFPGWATFELSRTDVALIADNTGDRDLVAHLLLDHVVPRIVSLRGDLMLHAAGTIGPSGRAHLFLGRTGAGKSTIAASLMSHGWALLDDDGIRVTTSDAIALASPGSADIRLLPDSAADLLPGVLPLRPIADGNPKRRYVLDDHRFAVATTPAPVRGVYVLARSGTSETDVELLRLAEAVGTITDHAFHLADEPASLTRQAFEQASALTTTASVWRLSYPEGLDRLDATCSMLGELDARS